MNPKIRKFSFPGTQSIASLSAAFFTLTILVACSNLAADNHGPCDPNDPNTPPQYDEMITITYKTVGGCAVPDFVDRPFFEVDAGDRIGWRSADCDTDFTIYFSPFAGDPIKGTNGQTSPQQVLPTGVPTGVTYKYTIVADDCPDHPLDPYFRIR